MLRPDSSLFFQEFAPPIEPKAGNGVINSIYSPCPEWLHRVTDYRLRRVISRSDYIVGQDVGHEWTVHSIHKPSLLPKSALYDNPQYLIHVVNGKNALTGEEVPPLQGQAIEIAR